MAFQFTHPGRGATFRRITLRCSAKVSIHAPREGCDRNEYHVGLLPGAFQFTHPGRGATPRGGVTPAPLKVSIHAPREGCDLTTNNLEIMNNLVSIHAPREGCDVRSPLLQL